MPTFDEVQPLLVLQQFDLEILQKQKKLDSLPQKTAILEIRHKKAEVQSKSEQVQELMNAAVREYDHRRFEDDQLAAKEAEAQLKIESAGGDYRAVESYTKELEGFAERREALKSSMAADASRIDQIKAVQTKVEAALAQLEAEESRQTESYKAEGGKITEELLAAKTSRDALAGKLDKDLVARYEKSAKRFGGVGVCKFVDGACSACRNRLDGNRIPQIMSEAPLSTCPHCGRLMVVSRD